MSELDELRIVDQLKAMGLLDEALLDDAVKLAKQQGIGLVQALLVSGMVSAGDIAAAVQAAEEAAAASGAPPEATPVEPAEQPADMPAQPPTAQGAAKTGPSSRAARRPSASLDAYEVDIEAVRAVPRALADEYCVLPLQISDDRILVAMPDADNVFALDAIRDHTNRRVEAVEVDERELRKAIDHHYAALARDHIKLTTPTKDLTAPVQEQAPTVGATIDRDLLEVLDQGPVVRVVQQLITDAVRMNASDIHIEPRSDHVQVRVRVDGRLMTVAKLPKSLQQATISRVKILAEEDIAETRVPQDGRFAAIVDDKAIDLRVSTLPTYWGEKAVLRILDKSRVFVSLKELGFRPDMLEEYEKLIHLPQGMILVTGPTGSGKSTTLYATLHTIKDETKNITTVEDPIEYEIDGINHTQVNPQIDLDFARALRHILRQDPDIILVGEIRDLETAEMAFRAALTGHLVFSTLHTNDAPSATTRLRDMGVEPYIIASSLVGVLAQRLVRRLCTHCREQVEPTPAELERLQLTPEQASRIRFHRGRGCQYCRNTGYSGRVALYELLVVTDEIRDAIVRGASAHELRAIAIRAGMKPLKHDGLVKVHQGITSAAEVISVMFAVDAL